MTEQSQLGPSQEGTVVLDIGGDVGALLLYTGPELHLAEIEVSRVDGAPPLADGFGHPHDHQPQHGHSHDHGDEHGDHDHGAEHGHDHNTGDEEHDRAHRTHVAVRERQAPAGVQYAAVYAGVYTGDYTVWGTDGHPAGTVTIVGGQVTELDWR